jgi:hypothetical protein
MNLTFGNDLFMYGFDRSKTNTWQFSNKDNEGAAFWKDLANDPVFLCLLARRWKELTAPGNPFNREVIESFIDQTILHIREASEREQFRWGTVGTLDGNVLKIKKFIQDRTSWINSQFSVLTNCTYPEPPSLVISKIMYQPRSGSTDPEFIEIFNNSNTVADLTGVYFGGTGFVFQFPPYSLILPGASVILTNSTAGFIAKYGATPFGEYIRALPDKGFDLLLLDGFGTVIDRVSYSSLSPWPDAAGNGKYIELQDINSDNADPQKWIATDNIRVSAGMTEARYIRLFPNPIRDILHIESDGIIERIELTDAQGRILLRTVPDAVAAEIDAGQIQPGIYFLKVNSGKRMSIHKVVKY